MTFTASVTPTGGATGTPTGTVQFEDNGADIGSPVTLDSSGQATFSTSSASMLTAGANTITAVYSGDTNFNGSTSANLTETINTGTVTTSVSASADPVTIGQSVILTATVSPAGGVTLTPTGTIQFEDDGTDIGAGRAQRRGPGDVQHFVPGRGTSNDYRDLFG